MKFQTIDYLDKVADIAKINLQRLEQTTHSRTNSSKREIMLIFDGYLQMHDAFSNSSHLPLNPDPGINRMAKICCEMREQMNSTPRILWSQEDEGLFKFIVAFIYLFKHLYVVQH